MADKVSLVFPTASYDQLVNAIRQLPSELRPIYFSFSERVQSRENLIEDAEKFSDFFERSKRISTCLIGEKIAFDLSPNNYRDAERRPTHGKVFVDVKRGFKYKDQLQKLLHLLIEASDAPFGYVGEYAEWQYRNYLEKKWANPKDHAGSSSISFVVGGDFRRYLTGLYWYTVFEEAYLQEHGVSPEKIAEIAIDYEQRPANNGRNFHCFKFFDSSKEWLAHAEKLDNFCRDNKQFFSMSRIKGAIDAAETDDALKEAVSFYRM